MTKTTTTFKTYPGGHRSAHRDIHPCGQAHRTSDQLDRSSLMAATFIPSSGQGIAFGRPIVPVGSVFLCMLGHPNHHPHINPIPGNFPETPEYPMDAQDPTHRDSTCFRGQCFRGVFRGFRGFRGVAWERVIGIPGVVGISGFFVPAGRSRARVDHQSRCHPRLLETFLTLHDLRSRMADRPVELPDTIRLPPPLLGFSTSASSGAVGRGGAGEERWVSRIRERPTRWVLNHARRYRLTPARAWRELDAATRPQDDLDMTGLRLVDLRLCVDDRRDIGHLPRVLRAYHDLRLLLGRQTTNPVRRVTRMQDVNPAAAVVGQIKRRRRHACDPGRWTQAQADLAMQRMRERIGGRHVFYDEFDLREALINPSRPLRVHDFNPLRVLKEHDPGSIARGLRGLILPRVSAGCTDFDLMQAFESPDQPLIASAIAGGQVWQPQDSSR